MKRFLLFTALLINCVARADELGDEVAALKVELPAGRTVSSNELRQVLQLAHRAGMKRVFMIAPLRSQWGEPGLFLTSAEIVEGRRIRQQALSVWHDDWRTEASPHRDYAQRLGKFSHVQTRAHLREWATFKVNGQFVRLECNRDTDLQSADKILEALFSGPIEYSSASVESKVRAMNFSAPTYISYRGGIVWVGFKHSDPLCGDSIRAKLVGDKLVIEDAMTACA